MGVPRAHATKGHQGRRRSHLALKPQALVSCSHCKQPTYGHRVCLSCGYYGSREVVNLLARELKKKEKKQKRTSA